MAKNIRLTDSTKGLFSKNTALNIKQLNGYIERCVSPGILFGKIRQNPVN